MAIDVNATTKDYTTILYNKTEINALNSTETIRVNGELALKSLKADEGSPSGIATLDPAGKVNVVELPIATLIESGDNTNEETLITPYTMDYQIDQKLNGKADQSSLDTTDSAVALNTTFREERTYDHANVTGVTIVGDTYEQVNTLVTPTRVAGVYQLTLSMIYTLNSVVNGAYFRFSLDGGITYTEVRKESKDVTDKITETYITVDNFTGGVKNISIEARKEKASDVLTLLDQTIIYQRKA